MKLVCAVLLLLVASSLVDTEAVAPRFMQTLQRRTRASVKALGDFDNSVFTDVTYLGSGAAKFVFKAKVDKTKTQKLGIDSGILDTLNGKDVAIACEKTVGSTDVKDDVTAYELFKQEGINTSPALLSYHGKFKATCLNQDSAIFETGKKCQWMITDLMTGKDVKKCAQDNCDQVKDARDTTKPDKVRTLVKNCLTSLKVLHDKHITHADFNERNIRILPDDKIMIFDFGSSKKQASWPPAKNNDDDVTDVLRYFLGWILKGDQIKPWQDINTQLAGTPFATDAADKCANAFANALKTTYKTADEALADKYFNGKDHSSSCQ